MPHNRRPEITYITQLHHNVCLSQKGLVRKVRGESHYACHSHVKAASKAGHWDCMGSFLCTSKRSWIRTRMAWNSEWKEHEEQDFTERERVFSPTDRIINMKKGRSMWGKAKRIERKTMPNSFQKHFKMYRQKNQHHENGWRTGPTEMS